jgi:nucleotide-binding universal stress UspA family protein
MKIESVFVASDLSETSDEAIRQGDAWAKAYRAKLTVAFVLPKRVTSDPFWPQRATAETLDLIAAERAASIALTDRTREITGRGPDACSIVITNGSPIAGILGAAKAARADVLVVGPDRSDVALVAERVARHAPCPVLIARPAPETGVVIAGTDLSDPSLTAVDVAAEAARVRQGPLTIMHVVESPHGPTSRLYRLLGQTPPRPKSEIPETRAELQRRLKDRGTNAEVVVVEGEPASALLRLATARVAELVVIGTRGWSEDADIPLGSVAEIVVRSATCSVLVVRV